MFGIFKSKEQKIEDRIQEIGETLFGQIIGARDEAKSGGIVSEEEFNNRLNRMFTAGYLIGFVDGCLIRIFDENEDKKKYSEQIFETIFPGTGVKFVKSKLALRTVADTISEDDENYQKILAQCHEFDIGMKTAEAEVDGLEQNELDTPVILKQFLLLGEIIHRPGESQEAE